MKKLLDIIHPGEILLEEFLKPNNISQEKLSRDIDVPKSRISNIVHGTRAITADTALRLATYFSTTPQFWLNLQSEYELCTIRRTSWADIEKNIRRIG
jgi:addiction module HigA family antidote